jgi:hypothetical protein
MTTFLHLEGFVGLGRYYRMIRDAAQCMGVTVIVGDHGLPTFNDTVFLMWWGTNIVKSCQICGP